ncbi:MAG: acetate--CoA ligase [Candidatus Cloacimonetes bacterium]|nr:acetate--CoA ligase [Candidatus Cloacimonadota bacterium]
MKPKIIRKTKDLLKVPPNLADYEKTYKSFSWNGAEAELDWFPGKRLNAAYNAVDRNAQNERKNKVALYWEGEDGTEIKYTFAELSALSSRFANVLKKLDISRGNRVFIFLPRVPELFISFLGILKMGGIAGTLFAAFGEQALLDRLDNSDAKILITNTELKKRVDKIKDKLSSLEKIILIDEVNRRPFLQEQKLINAKPREKDTLYYYCELAKVADKTKIAEMRPTDPAFMLYTSGTTGKPKGVIHTHRAILHEHMTTKYVLDLREDDTYWCTADPGWVTGIAYEILGTWSNGASTLIYEGRFDPDKWYSLLEEYKITVWYTAPTAIRMLMAAGNDLVKKYNLSSLRHLCSVGEPLNPEAVCWGLSAFGRPFHDNWWQTETGGILIANYPCLDIKPGSMGKPVPGVVAGIVDDEGNELGINQEGNLAIRPGWPSMMAKIWRRPKKYQSYFVNNWYMSGDRALKDKDGYFWFIGRADDVIKTSGERVGPFEVESALVEHPDIVEAAVIGKPDVMRGEIIKAFVVLSQEKRARRKEQKEKLIANIQTFIKKKLAGHAYPREIEFVDTLPKTRSGKIMRRLLKAQELGLPLGDTSTMTKEA